MDIDKVRGLSDTELVEELGNARHELYDLRFQLATRQLTDYSQIPQTRRTIARILTVMTERQLGIGPARPATKAGEARAARASRGKAATESGTAATEIGKTESETSKASARSRTGTARAGRNR